MARKGGSSLIMPLSLLLLLLLLLMRLPLNLASPRAPTTFRTSEGGDLRVEASPQEGLKWPPIDCRAACAIL
eukprot:724095-Pyramimonas_sp.AAC.1